jgi:hypothetical protein
MWLNWLPWKYVVRRIARAHGFIDPISLLSRMHGFAQPSEVAAPIELLRAGVVFHARGLMNTRAIQQNLDWVWPYWVERQFDPKDIAFLPRAFSITHVNLTTRNWTAVGVPGCNALPIVDPRGLVTPYFDGWSLDGWILTDDGEELLPSQLPDAQQRLLIEEDRLAVRTETARPGLRLATEAWVEPAGEDALCRVAFEAHSDRPGWLAVALRPVNPEGVSFIHHVELGEDRRTWCIDRREARLSAPADRHALSDYHGGDVFLGLRNGRERMSGTCKVGMATAAALFRLDSGTREVSIEVPLSGDRESAPLYRSGSDIETWATALGGACRAALPDPRFQFLYDAALRTLVLHTPREAYPGPYTYKRFWYRDAAFIVHSLLCAGLKGRAEAVLDYFPEKQHLSGFFKSQEGEWDSNGEVLWIFRRFTELTGEELKPEWKRAALRGAEWIVFKRLPDNLSALHAGLMPAGFSAEHLGSNDFYYWDDFWSVAGLRAAAAMRIDAEDSRGARRFEETATALANAIERSLADSRARRGVDAYPASPYRRMDAGAVGSIVADYPLQLLPPGDPRMMATVEFLMDRCFVQGAFFQDMIHSGINAYLTLQIAQVLLRAGDPRYFELVKTVAEKASPTGQWPEAIHPHTGGGCMGDGQHVWAAAEWVILIRNLFVREEDEVLILLSGIPPEWLEPGTTLRFGPAPTPYGDVSLSVEALEGKIRLSCDGQWRRTPRLEVRLPGCEPRTITASEAGRVEIACRNRKARQTERVAAAGE